MRSSLLLALGVWASGVVAQDSTTQDASTQASITPTATGLSPACSQIQAEQSQALAVGAVVTHTPSIAWECMGSVPINKTDAMALVTWAQTYFPFMSTIGWLKNPPPSYVGDAVDVLGELDTLAATIRSDSPSLTSQLDLDLALRNLTLRTRDFHNTAFDGKILGKFSFVTNFSVVAVSLDGRSLPKIYSYEDIIKTGTGPNSGGDNSYTPSAIQSLSGQDPVQFLRNYSAINLDEQFIEEHTSWNNLMSNQASGLGRASRAFNKSSIYNGDTLAVEFENGTSFTSNYIAYSACSITSLQSMEDIYNLCVLGIPPAGSTSTPTLPGAASTSLAATDLPDSAEATVAADYKAAQISPIAASSWGGAYPTNPAVIQNDLGGSGIVTSYNLKEESLAVLSIPQFTKNNATGANPEALFIADFSATIGGFIENSTKEGMTKLVIDLTGNDGGSAILAFETFKRFFPDIWPYGGWNLHTTPQINAVGSGFTNIDFNATAQSIVRNQGLGDVIDPASPVNVFGYLSDNGTVYSAWDQAAGPDVRNGDNFTNTIRFDYTNSTVMSGLADGQLKDLYGYGSRPASGGRPWDASNIVLLTDGTCGSTCAILAEVMKTDAGVKRVVMGGLPTPGPMQAVGGSRGAQVVALPGFYNNTAIVRIAKLGDDIQSNLPPDMTPPRLGLVGNIKGRVNSKNMVRHGSDVPLQFVYEAADCRLWYTKEMMNDYTVLWKAAADAIWKNNSMCVDGSTNQVTAQVNVTSIDAPNATTIDNGAQASTTSTSSPSGTSGSPSSTTSASKAAAGLVAQSSFVAFIVVLVSAMVFL